MSNCPFHGVSKVLNGMNVTLKKTTGESLQAKQQDVFLQMDTASDVAKQMKMIDFQEEDIRLLNVIQPMIIEHIDEITSSFYQTVLNVQVLKAIIEKNSTVEKLKATLKNHLIEMFNGRIDHDFINKRLRIAKMHQKIGLEPKWYLGAFQNLQNTILDVVNRIFLHPEERLAFNKVISKLLNLEQQLVLEAYEKENMLQKELVYQHQKWYKSLYDNNSDGIISVDMNGKMIDFNPAIIEMTGLRIDICRNQPISSIDSIIAQDQQEKTFLKSFGGKRKSFETTIIHQKGHRVDLSVMNVPVEVDGKVVGSYVIAKNITVEKEAKEKIRHMAFRDELTGLPNRRLFNEMLSDAIQRSKRTQTSFSVMVLDIDRFKMINDSLGHAYGDLFLQMVTERLQKAASGYPAEIARMGGDEFTVLCHNELPSDISAELAERCIQAIQVPYRLKDNDFYVTASIGLATYPQHAKDADRLLKNADTAMYEVKKQGKNGYRFYSESLDTHVQERVELERDLRKAIERNELVVYYQPQVNAHDHQIIGVEALLRWNHSRKGIISPAVFVPIAEESGLIDEIGTWVMREACLQMRLWHDAGGLRIPVSVNLSTQQFHQANLTANVSRILHETKLDPQYLELEITESMMMDAERSTSTLIALTKIGVRISMDDFGTGYSSLNYLKLFPISKLKIDQSFIKDVTRDDHDRAIVATIISMAHHLKMDVIAEGVETKEQLHLLKEHGCDYIQGYYFSRPLPAVEVESTFMRK